MTEFTKTVFLVILGVAVAFVLYVVLFGTYSLQGKELQSGTGYGSEHVTWSVAWKGALWYLAEAIETPISRYYYEYCYLPNIHKDDYVDEALGGSVSSYWNGTLQKTETDLSKDVDMYTFSSTSDVKYYSTGWK